MLSGCAAEILMGLGLTALVSRWSELTDGNTALRIEESSYLPCVRLCGTISRTRFAGQLLSNFISSQTMGNKATAYVLENIVKHARLLPTNSAHAFNYKTFSLFLPLSALESHQLDLGDGWLFGFDDAASFSLTGIRPEAYLSSASEKRSLRAKLAEVLERFGHDPKALRDAWMQTMPRYMGFGGINPLTIYYCYAHGSDDLWTVVLEVRIYLKSQRIVIDIYQVHNTFGEQHVYALSVGSGNELENVRHGFDHAWTFPRQFHVSPFNDRSGYYTCSITNPPHPPDVAPPKAVITNSLPPSVHIELRTAQTLELKLIAALRPLRMTPLTSRSLLLVLARQPFALFLSFARIVWHAAILHYGRRLDVYPRPEPRVVPAELEGMLPPDQNAVQRASGQDGELGVGGGIGWQPEGMLERYARRRVEAFIERRTQESGITVALEAANPEYGTKYFSGNPDRDNAPGALEEKYLHIAFRSSRFFTILLTCPSAAHALLLGKDAERLFSVSDETLFLTLFSSDATLAVAKPQNILDRLGPWHLAQRKRLGAIPTSLRGPSPTSVPTSASISLKATVPTIHPLDASLSYFPALLSFHVVRLFIWISNAERVLLTFVGARFVRGTEPWTEWKRAEDAVFKGGRASGEGDNDETVECPPWLGSVRRP